MAFLILFYSLLVLALVALSIYEHVNATSISLPHSPAVTVLSFILPLIGAANVFYVWRWLRSPNKHREMTAWHPAVPQVLQGILTTVLATLFFRGVVRDRFFRCMMESTWQSFWTTKDRAAIRRIQDAFNCCGFNSPVDRAWPFPRGSNGVTCTEQYGRSSSCASAWSGAMQQASGLDFGVVVLVGIFQIGSLLFLRHWASRRGSAWARMFNDQGRSRAAEGTRPLLADVENSTNDETGTGPGTERNGRSAPNNGYGGAGPRVEPSNLREDGNEWESE